MIRVVIENLLLFLVPAFLYFAYALITDRREQSQSETPTPASRIFDEAPYGWLFFAGTAVVLATIFAFGSVSGGKPGQHYTPPTMKDGRIVPGHID